jgi:hypothetical protein
MGAFGAVAEDRSRVSRQADFVFRLASSVRSQTRRHIDRRRLEPRLKILVLVAAIFALTPFGAFAQAAEEQYIASRDRYIEAFRANRTSVAADKRKVMMETARSDLERQLRSFVGRRPVPARKIDCEIFNGHPSAFGA